jgi:hypothetical protein
VTSLVASFTMIVIDNNDTILPYVLVGLLDAQILEVQSAIKDMKLSR